MDHRESLKEHLKEMDGLFRHVHNIRMHTESIMAKLSGIEEPNLAALSSHVKGISGSIVALREGSNLIIDTKFQKPIQNPLSNVPEESIADLRAVKEERTLYRTRTKRAFQSCESEMKNTFHFSSTQIPKRLKYEFANEGIKAIDDIISLCNKNNPKLSVKLNRNETIDQLTGLIVIVEDILKASICIRPFQTEAGIEKFEIMSILIGNPKEKPEKHVKSEHLLFEKITYHAMAKLDELAFEQPERALFILIDWLGHYSNLFEAPCEKCGQRLYSDSEHFKLLPPTLRVWVNDKYLSFHKQCAPL